MDKGNTIKKRPEIYKKTVDGLQDTVTIDSEAESEFNTRKQIKYGTTYQAAWGMFKEYCDNTTIHGIRYMGETKRPLLERVFWIFFFCLSIFVCFNLTKTVWVKWHNDPVIMSFAEESTPIWEIPFPSVTICPVTKSSRQVFDFTDMWWKLFEGNDENITEKEHYFMEAISQVCWEDMFTSFTYGNKFAKGSDLISALEEANVAFNQTLYVCRWRNNYFSCDKFHKIITEEGLCYSFNAFHPKDIYRQEAFVDDSVIDDYNNENTTLEWNLEDGYSKEAGPETFPHRALAAGVKGGLLLYLESMKDDLDLLCRGPISGFKILLHTPGDVPQLRQQFLRVPSSQEVLIAIKPKIITTLRQCYSQKERYLKYFMLYTQKNCELECLSNYTLRNCGCVKFSMPRTPETPVCGAGSMSCVNKAEDSLLLQEFQLGLKRSAENVRIPSDCNCLPLCNSIVYETEMSMADYDFTSQFKAFKEYDFIKDNPGTQMSLALIYFKEIQFLASKRSDLYGFTDFLANCGGLLGLFMGVSTLSIVELIYFCTVRLCINLRMRRKKRLEMHQLDNDDGFHAKLDVLEKNASN